MKSNILITSVLLQYCTVCAIRPASIRQITSWSRSNLLHRRQAPLNNDNTLKCSLNDDVHATCHHIRQNLQHLNNNYIVSLARSLRGGGEDEIGTVNDDGSSRRRRRRRRKRKTSSSDGVSGGSESALDEDVSTNESPMGDDVSLTAGNDSSSILDINEGTDDGYNTSTTAETSDSLSLAETTDDDAKLDLSNKKTRRRKRHREGMNDSAAHATDSNESIEPFVLAGDSQDEFTTTPENETSIQTKRRRKKRRADINLGIDSTNDSSIGNQSVNNIPLQSMSVSSDSSSEGERTKKRKSRRRRTIASVVDGEVNTSGTTTLETCGDASRDDSECMVHAEKDAGKEVDELDGQTSISPLTDFDEVNGAADEVSSTQSELIFPRSHVDYTSDDVPTLLSIDASIEIPSEEIIPESIDACIETKKIPIDPSDTIVVDAAESFNRNAIVTARHEDLGTQSTDVNDPIPIHDDIEEASANESILEWQPSSAGDNHSVDVDSTEPHSSIPLSTGWNSEIQVGMIDTDAETPLSIPREQFLTESIDLAGASDDNHQDFDQTIEGGSKDEDKYDDALLTENDILSNLPSTLDGAKVIDGVVELEIQMPIDEESNIEVIPSDGLVDDELSARHVPEDDKTEETIDVSMDSEDGDGTTDPFSSESLDKHVEEDNAIMVDASIDGEDSSGTIHPLLDGATPEKIGDTVEELVDDDCVTLSIVTWNLGEASPSEKECSFIKRFRKDTSGIGSDLVMIGAQECEDIKPRRTEGSRSRHLRRMGIMMLGEEYVPLAIHSLGGIQCAFYCHRDVLGDVEMISLADVTCGVGNVFHNKGAIGVYLKMKRHDTENDMAKSSRYLFVTGHLAAHVKNVDARNSDFKRIISELEAQAPIRFLRPKRNSDGSLAECDGSNLLSSMDHVFFAGDLNYRVDLPREYVERCIVETQQQRSESDACSTEHATNVNALLNKLLRRDQLLQAIASGQAFSGFNEGKITFLPTFKFDKGTSHYDTSHKQRVPAWTDRIVFRSNKIRVLEYQSIAEAKHSDHRPVFGTFQLGWEMKEKMAGSRTNSTRRRKKTKRVRSGNDDT
jgi:hypothetical protein